MSYELLSSLFYKDEDIYNQVYSLRQSSESAINLSMSIKGCKAFIIVIPSMLSLIEKIFLLNENLVFLEKELSPEAIKSFLLNSMIEEIMLTNDIEGINSTKKEITLAMKPAAKGSRFWGLVQKYIKLLDSEDIPLNTVEDIRNLYNEIVLKEIADENIPDGKVFRKESVSVVSPTGKEVHTGLFPEKKLINFMNQSLEFLNDDNLSHLIRISAFHYLFGYMHPFYDGNGRMSRFISSYLLRDVLHPLVSVRISYVIKNNRKMYYDAFEICNDPKNKGDLTPFILSFLQIIIEAEKSLLESLSRKKQQWDFYEEKVNQYCSKGLTGKINKEILLELIQNALFSDDWISLDDIRQHVKKSENIIRKCIQDMLSENTILCQRDGHRKVYTANLTFFDNYKIS